MVGRCLDWRGGEKAHGRSGVSCEAAGRGVRALGRWGVGVLGSGVGGGGGAGARGRGGEGARE